MPPTPAPRLESWRWAIVWLMFFATMINYMDRQALNSTNQSIMKEFQLKEKEYAQLEFWFGIAFCFSQLIGGWLADRVSLRWLYPSALFAWSIAGYLTGSVHVFEGLLVCRFLLGAAEAFNWPCAVGVVRRLIPLESRSLANGIFHGGASIGAFLTPIVVNVILFYDPSNWRLVFQVIGVVGLFWIFFWFGILNRSRAAILAERPRESGAAHAAESFAGVLRLRTFWIGIFVSITVNFSWHFFRIWLPRFFDKDLHLSQEWTNWVLAAYFIAADIGCMGAGFLTRALIRRGTSPERARFQVMVMTATLCFLAVPAGFLKDPVISVALLIVVGMGAMGGFANFFALPQEISPYHTSFCMGILGSVAWLVIAVVNLVIGDLSDRLSSLGPCIMGVGFIPILGALSLHFWPEKSANERQS